jgi:uncharacterized protein
MQHHPGKTEGASEGGVRPAVERRRSGAEEILPPAAPMAASAVPEALCRPEAFPSPRPRAVSFQSTHASWVFLTEDEVWKIKRPVNFGFLDYSDLEKRRRACYEEVRLGARLAPEIYRGVQPVYRGAGGLSFLGPGPIVDHAVRMQRLAEADSAAALLRRGQLTPEHLSRLTERLARFYEEAPSAPDLGSPGVLAMMLAENQEQTLPFADRFVPSSTVARLYHWQQGELAASASCLYQRVWDDKIRDGHGDLRLEHVYFPGGLEGQPVVIDPIEFNRRFRCADVALDAAFLAMELEANDRPSLAALYLSRFARDTGDYEFYPLLDLYLSYRAWVRAKVACFVAADPTTAPEKARRKSAEAERLFALAESYTRPSRGCQHLIAVGGLIGTGKSTVADALSLELQLPAVSSDATRKSLAGLPPTARAGAGLYSEERTRATYEELLRRAERVLASGRGVVLDATFSEPGFRAAARELARRKQRPFLFVDVECDDDTIRARLRAREGRPSVSDAREDLLPLLRRRFRPPEELAPDERITIDGTTPPRQAAQQIRQRLS